MTSAGISKFSGMRSKIEASHELIVRVLADIRPLVRSYSQVKPLLIELRGILQSHWGLCADPFWTQLTDSFPKGETPAILEFLQFDLKELKIHYLEFFDRYCDSPNSAAARNFPKDFVSFCSVLTGRISIEQDYLLPLIND